MDPHLFLPCFDGSCALRLGHKRKEKTGSITCRTDLTLRLIRGIYYYYYYYYDDDDDNDDDDDDDDAVHDCYICLWSHL